MGVCLKTVIWGSFARRAAPRTKEQKRSMEERKETAVKPRRKKKKFKKRWVVLAVVVLVAAGGFLLRKKGGNTQTVLASDTQVLSYTDLESSVSATGTVESSDTTKVYSTLAYQVKSVLVEVGDTVQEGDLLAELDAEPIENQIATQQTSMEVASGSAGAQVQSAYDAYENFKQGLDWLLLGYEKHEKMQHFVMTLNHFYLENRELWEVDTGWDGYEWIEPDDRDRSVIAFRRKDRKGRELVVVCNFCPVLRENYRLGLPKQGWYVPVLNTDDEAFGGYGFAPETVRTEKKPSHGQMQSGLFRVPPMSVCFYRYHRARPQTKP